LTKYPQFYRVTHFQKLQWSEREWQRNVQEISLGSWRIRIRQITRDHKTAIRIKTHPVQDASPSRSTSTRLGNTRFPKIRWARASTSGHLTRFRLFPGLIGSSFSARTASRNFSRSRAGKAFTSLINSTALTLKYVNCFSCQQQGPFEHPNVLLCKY